VTGHAPPQQKLQCPWCDHESHTEPKLVQHATNWCDESPDDVTISDVKARLRRVNPDDEGAGVDEEEDVDQDADDEPSSPVKCSHCGDAFDTEQGLKIHVGQVHKEPSDDHDLHVDQDADQEDDVADQLTTRELELLEQLARECLGSTLDAGEEQRVAWLWVRARQMLGEGPP